jgi:hypothetical protein
MMKNCLKLCEISDPFWETNKETNRENNSGNLIYLMITTYFCDVQTYKHDDIDTTDMMILKKSIILKEK